MSADDGVGHAVVNALDEDFRKSPKYAWSSSSDQRIHLRLGITTSRDPSGGSMISVVLAGVSGVGEPLILRQYVTSVPEGGADLAARSIFQDMDSAIIEAGAIY
jgi:hypothetical protein